MSKSEDFNDDEYVAKLLAEDARKSSVRYASAGMSALLPKRPSTAAPKPNTRFLKTLVREADTHNAALKKKEELEARIRLRSIREKESDSRRGHDPERPTKRRRLSDEGDRSRTSDPNPSRHESRRERQHGQTRSPESRQRDRRKRYDTDSSDRYHHSQHDQPSSRHRSGSHDKTSDDRDRGGKPSDTNKRHTRRQHESHSDSETRHQERSSHQRDDHKPRRRRSRSRSRSRSTPSSTTSDPLANLIGPLPAKKNESTTATTSSPLRKRGRGFLKSETATSNIDHHFSTAYNPSNDTPETSTYNPASDDDDQDWDNALEALRDRRAWQNKQAERMREAGFGDEEIERWEKSALTTKGGSLLADDGDRDVRDVKWRKRGEDKEWDSGKIRLEDPEDGKALPTTATTTASVPTPARKKSRTDGKRVDDVWQRKDSALVRQFRKALG